MGLARVNLDQAHKVTGVAKQRLRDLIKNGELTAVREGRNWSIKPVDLERLVGMPDTMTRLSHLEQTFNAQQNEIVVLEHQAAEILSLKQRLSITEETIKQLTRVITRLQNKYDAVFTDQGREFTHNSIAARLAVHGVSYNSAKSSDWKFPATWPGALTWYLDQYLSVPGRRRSKQKLYQCMRAECECHQILPLYSEQTRPRPDGKIPPSPDIATPDSQ